MARKKASKRGAKKGVDAEEPIERKDCPECGSTNVIYSKIGDNTVCQDCGAIFAKLIPEEEQKIEKVKGQK